MSEIDNNARVLLDVPERFSRPATDVERRYIEYMADYVASDNNKEAQRLRLDYAESRTRFDIERELRRRQAERLRLLNGLPPAPCHE